MVAKKRERAFQRCDFYLIDSEDRRQPDIMLLLTVQYENQEAVNPLILYLTAIGVVIGRAGLCRRAREPAKATLN